MKSPSRRGFTLVELLIVIAIIGTLVGLLLPAVNAARERARQGTCLNNLSELGKAMVSYTTQKNGEFPGLIQVQKRDPGLPPNQYNGTPDIAISWAAKLLPQLDQQGLWDQMLTTDIVNFSNPPRMEIFICPSDAGTNQELAQLTYVGNSGYFDFNPNAVLTGSQVSDIKENGLLHDLRPGRNGPLVRQIKDGSATTLLLSENIHKDEDAFGLTNSKNTWLGPIFPPDGSNKNYEQTFGMVWTYYPTRPEDPSKHQNESLEEGMQERFNRDSLSPTSYGAEGRFYARPASAHPELFNVLFAGSNARAVRADIEYRVYQQLMTPNGAKAEALDSPNDVTFFMNPPLKESDY